MTKAQIRWLKDAYKAGVRLIVLPTLALVPSGKFEIDVVYVCREQKERR